jgi:8-oxo-dGTP pyrophosphatase MutT (NUDIX family)
MQDNRNFIIWLREYLKTEKLPGEAAQRLMMPQNRAMPKVFPENSKPSAVLLLLYPYKDDYNIVLIERSKNGGHHRGQIAFPGGKQEQDDASLWMTAIRESYEEVGLSAPVELIGGMTPIYIPVSGFVPQVPSLKPSDGEVASIIAVNLSSLFANKDSKKIPVNDHVFLSTPVYNLTEEHFVWGATAMVLSELEVLYNTYLIPK